MSTIVYIVCLLSLMSTMVDMAYEFPIAAAGVSNSKMSTMVNEKVNGITYGGYLVMTL